MPLVNYLFNTGGFINHSRRLVVVINVDVTVIVDVDLDVDAYIIHAVAEVS